MAFLILTIGGERLELSLVLKPLLLRYVSYPECSCAFCRSDFLWLSSTSIAGTRLSGLSILVLSIWFLKNDLARRNLRHSNPLTRYIAICLFSGFIWLGVGGPTFQLIVGATYAGLYYDAVLHAVFLGFVMAMIFGHTPIISPAILGVPVNFHLAFYIHLVLLHLSLILRVAGDLSNQLALRKYGGLFNEVAILLFLGLTVYTIIKGKG